MSSPPSPPDVIVLPANATLAVAEELLPAFRAAAAAGPISVDASQTSALGQAMLQLLLAAARHPAGFELLAPSEAVRDRLAQLGLTELAA